MERVTGQFKSIATGRVETDFRATHTERMRNAAQTTLKTFGGRLDKGKLSLLGSTDRSDLTAPSTTRNRLSSARNKGRSTFSQFYLDDRVKDMVSIASIDQSGAQNINDEVYEIMVRETSTQAPTLIDRLQKETMYDN